MGWLMKNGTYPYLEGISVIGELLTEPYPLSIWQCSAGSYPICALHPQNAVLGCFANAVSLRTMRYEGTMAEWEALQKGTEWNTNALFGSVQCSDGNILLEK